MPRFTTLLVVSSLLAAGCPRPSGQADVAAPVDATAKAADAIAIYEDLEGRIAAGSDTEEDRQSALTGVRAISDDGSAGYAFARAAIVGRVAELRGVKAGKLVTEVEQFARLSIERDASFRDKAATRMLGSLYVMAPGRLVEHGDSEAGLTLLEDLTAQQPESVVNHLRLSEAYIHLGDPEPASPHLCIALAKRAELRADEAALLDRLVVDAGGNETLQCDAAAS